jgi:hypothetical protein
MPGFLFLALTVVDKPPLWVDILAALSAAAAVVLSLRRWLKARG